LIELLGVALDSPGLNFHADCRCLFLRILTLWLRDDSLGVNRHRLSVRVCHFAFEHLSDCSWGQRLFLHLIFITLCRFTDLWTALLDCLDLLLALLVGSLEYFQKVIILCDWLRWWLPSLSGYAWLHHVRRLYLYCFLGLGSPRSRNLYVFFLRIVLSRLSFLQPELLGCTGLDDRWWFDLSLLAGGCIISRRTNSRRSNL